MRTILSHLYYILCHPAKPRLWDSIYCFGSDFVFHELESETWRVMKSFEKISGIVLIWNFLIHKVYLRKWTWNTFWKCINLLSKQSQIHPENSRQSLKRGQTIPVIILKDWQIRKVKNLDAIWLRVSIGFYLTGIYLQELFSLKSFPLTGCVFQAVPKSLVQGLVLSKIFICEPVKNDYLTMH